jgi:hypothetical protein
VNTSVTNVFYIWEVSGSARDTNIPHNNYDFVLSLQINARIVHSDFLWPVETVLLSNIDLINY